MAYQKVIGSVPVEKRETLSDKLIDLVLTSKNDGKMPSGLANVILYHWQRGPLTSDLGLAALLEAAVLLEPNKVVEILERDPQLMDAVKAVKEILMKAER